MNGQTGKFVGNLPVDKVAARKWTLGLTAAVGAASYAVMWLLWLAGTEATPGDSAGRGGELGAARGRVDTTQRT